MTVCIAARCGNSIVCAADRMLTSGDVEFEPMSRRKIFAVTKSIVLMTSGDASFQSAILRALTQQVADEVQAKPGEWMRTQDVANRYVRLWTEAKAARAEAELLWPLNLSRETFNTTQRLMDPGLVEKLAMKLVDYEVPYTGTLIAGNDCEGTHIYRVEDGELSSLSTVGFGAIGKGSRHAESQFMLARHSWDAALADTLLLTYVAKRRAQIAPGVGEATDLCAVIGLGGYTDIRREIIDALEREYTTIVKSEAAAMSKARSNITQFLGKLERANALPEHQASPERHTGSEAA
jgi:20S proteasome alpha/beta subunit